MARLSAKDAQYVLFSAALLLLMTPPCLAEAPASDPISAYEQKLFTQSFPSETMEQRLQRLETTLFGQPATGAIPERQTAIDKALAGTYKAAPETVPATTAVEPPPRKQDATTYPSVTTMEQKAFGRDFANEDITQRLSRLEMHANGRSSANLPLSERVDRLMMVISPQDAPAISNTTPAAPTRPRSVLDSLPNSSSQFTGNSSDVYGRLDSLEQQVFQRNMASGRMITERLDLMEQKLLGQRHSGESVDTRLKRIEDTLRPIQNRYAQGYYPPQPVNPAPQTFTYPTPAPAATPPSSARPNVQIGSGFSSNSSMTFSQDMLDMLPPDIRQQLQGSASTMGAPVQRYQSSSQSGLGGWNTRGAQTAIGNGSVIIREETMNNGIGGFPGFGFNSSGFSSFGGSGFGTPMYGLPSTTFSQPLDRFGNPLPYSGYTTVNPGFGRPGYVVPNGLGVPNRQNRQFMAPGGAGYQIMGPDGVVDTNMLQRLNQMERRVYGQPQPNMPYYNRLNQLEMSMLGQSFHGYSDVDRMNNLIQADTAQRLGRRMGRGFLGQLGRTAGSMMLGVPLSPVYPGAPVTTW